MLSPGQSTSEHLLLRTFENEFSHLHALLIAAKKYEWEFHKEFAKRHDIKSKDVHTTLDEIMADELSEDHPFQSTLGQITKDSRLYINIEKLYSSIIQTADHQLFMLREGHMCDSIHLSKKPFFSKYATFNLIFVSEKTKARLKKNTKKYHLNNRHLDNLGVCHEYIMRIFHDKLDYLKRIDYYLK